MNDAERKVQLAAFKKLFKLNPDVVDIGPIYEWMDDAIVGIVEYDGRLPNESKKRADRRMEIVEVYDNDNNSIVSYLRDLYPEKKSLPKWELIFSVFNEISAADNVIKQASTNKVLGKTSSVESSMSDVTSSTQATEEHVASGKTPDVLAHAPESKEVAQSGTVTKTESGDEYLSSNKSSYNMEEKIMANINDLKKAAGSAAPTTGGKQANISKVSQVAIGATAELLQSTLETRRSWTTSNLITKIICAQEAPAKRRLADAGIKKRYEHNDEGVKAAQDAIKEEYAKFLSATSGTNVTSIDQAPTGDARYANCVDEKNIKKAQIIDGMYKEALANLDTEFKGYFPADADINYTPKGYYVGSKAYSKKEFDVLLVDNSVGVIYAEGSIDAQGNVTEDATFCKMTKVTVKSKNNGSGMGTEQSSKKVVAVRPHNKKAFTAQPGHVAFLFPEYDAQAESYQSFNAEITVDGERMPATVTCFKLENGKKVQTGSTKKDGSVNYKKQTRSFKVSIKVQKPVKQFADQFKDPNADTVVTFARWEISAPKEKIDPSQLLKATSISSMPITDVLAAVFDGKVSIAGTDLTSSNAVQAVFAAANKKREQEAAAAQADLM